MLAGRINRMEFVPLLRKMVKLRKSLNSKPRGTALSIIAAVLSFRMKRKSDTLIAYNIYIKL